jgi:hypothetical protein
LAARPLGLSLLNAQELTQNVTALGWEASLGFGQLSSNLVFGLCERLIVWFPDTLNDL